MKDDNYTVIDKTMGVVSTVGMLVMVGGSLIPVPGLKAIGSYMAMGGMAARNALGLTEAYTRDEKNSDEIVNRWKDLAMDVGGMLIGGFAGAKGAYAKATVIKNGGNMLAQIAAEGGTDVAISIAGDLLMVSALNYDESLGQTLKNNFMGLMVSTITGMDIGRSLANTKIDTPKVETKPDAPRSSY